MDTNERPAPVLLTMPTQREIDRLEDQAEHAWTFTGWVALVAVVVGLAGCGVGVWHGMGGNWQAAAAAGGPGVLALALGLCAVWVRQRGFLSHVPDGSECVYYAGQYMEAAHQRAVAACAAHSDEAAARMEAVLLREQATACEHLAEQLRERADTLAGQL